MAAFSYAAKIDFTFIQLSPFFFESPEVLCYSENVTMSFIITDASSKLPIRVKSLMFRAV